MPFLSDHPRHVHRNAIKGSLFRAVGLCSDVQDFDKERLNILFLVEKSPVNINCLFACLLVCPQGQKNIEHRF
jgi:hypothetical protein